MTHRTRIVTLDAARRWRCSESRATLELPEAWAVLPPGDAAHTRRVKAGGVHWVLQERKGRRMFSRGVCAPTERIERVRTKLENERAKPEYALRLKSSRARSKRLHEDYVEEFRDAVLSFLAFNARHRALAEALADQVTEHTTPVGSGTVGRTKRIPIEDRAASAVIAWLRHSTTGYDHMDIARERGRRREVRRRLAQRSHKLLAEFRKDAAVDPEGCPLQQALRGHTAKASQSSNTPSPKAKPTPQRVLGMPAAPKANLWRSPLFKPA